MRGTILGDNFVMLCDWRGRCTWASTDLFPVKVGEQIWGALSSESQLVAQEKLGRVVTMREPCQLEMTEQAGNRYRVWLWPLDCPEMAVCMLGSMYPPSLR